MFFSRLSSLEPSQMGRVGSKKLLGTLKILQTGKGQEKVIFRRVYHVIFISLFSAISDQFLRKNRNFGSPIALILYQNMNKT